MGAKQAIPDPDYAKFNSPEKFTAIESIVAKRLREHPNAYMSYSGGSDSDIMLDLVQRVINAFNLPQIQYFFMDTGLEMKATRDHVKETAEKYGIEIQTVKPEKNIIRAVRDNGIPFISKRYSSSIENLQRHNVPISVAREFEAAEDKEAKYKELLERYPNSNEGLHFLLSCNGKGEPCLHTQISISSSNYLLEFMEENPIDFKVSAECCKVCKKHPAHKVSKGFEMMITGERRGEGGARAVDSRNNTCFQYQSKQKIYKLKPLFFVLDKDKEWYKSYYGIRYSDAYEVYGMTRTGCCGCPISYKAVEDLETLEHYEPNVAKAAWNVFGKSYEYREKYVDYRDEKLALAKIKWKAERKAKKMNKE